MQEKCSTLVASFKNIGGDSLNDLFEGAKNSDRKFHNKKEMNRHLRDNPSNSSVQTSDNKNCDKGIEIIKVIEKTADISRRPSNGGSRKEN